MGDEEGTCGMGRSLRIIWALDVVKLSRLHWLFVSFPICLEN